MGVDFIIVTVFIYFIATKPMDIFARCRQVKLPRLCEGLCTFDQHGVETCELRAAVLLPHDPRYEIAMPKVLPVLGETFSYLFFFSSRNRMSGVIILSMLNTRVSKRKKKQKNNYTKQI